LIIIYEKIMKKKIMKFN